MSAAGHVSFFRHPQRIWWRAALFQIHLWTGLVVGVYVCAIGLSGSVIVLEEELTRLSRPDLFKTSTTQTDSPRDRVPAILAAAERGFPQFRFTGIFFPTSKSPTVQLEGRSLNPQRPSDFVNVYIDPVTTRILGSTDRHFWISVTRQLHVRLLAGQAGLYINGTGAFVLLLLAGLGIVLWWPGVKHWSRPFRVDFRRKWSRINFDVHSALGFWALFFICVWGVSGVYLVWPDQFVSILDRITPIKAGMCPVVRVPVTPESHAEIGPMIRKAESLKPASHVLEVELPQENGDPLVVVTGTGDEFNHAVFAFFDPATGEFLKSWQRGSGSTVAVKSLRWMVDLHFGESWGLAVKLLWAILGLTLPALAITGAVMYWNRFLSKKLRKRKRLKVARIEEGAA